MAKFSLAAKVASLLTGALVFAPMGLLNAAVTQEAASQAATSATLVAYNNACEEDELLAGDEVTIDGETYVLEEDEDGLFIEYVLVDDETGEVDEETGVGTYSVIDFDSDCETVSFEQIEGTDSLVGTDIDEDE